MRRGIPTCRLVFREVHLGHRRSHTRRNIVGSRQSMFERLGKRTQGGIGRLCRLTCCATLAETCVRDPDWCSRAAHAKGISRLTTSTELHTHFHLRSVRTHVHIFYDSAVGRAELFTSWLVLRCPTRVSPSLYRAVSGIPRSDDCKVCPNTSISGWLYAA